MKLYQHHSIDNNAIQNILMCFFTLAHYSTAPLESSGTVFSEFRSLKSLGPLLQKLQWAKAL